jgi:hypothetical protein
VARSTRKKCVLRAHSISGRQSYQFRKIVPAAHVSPIVGKALRASGTRNALSPQWTDAGSIRFPLNIYIDPAGLALNVADYHQPDLSPGPAIRSIERPGQPAQLYAYPYLARADRRASADASLASRLACLIASRSSRDASSRSLRAPILAALASLLCGPDWRRPASACPRKPAHRQGEAGAVLSWNDIRSKFLKVWFSWYFFLWALLISIDVTRRVFVGAVLFITLHHFPPLSQTKRKHSLDH